MPSPLPPRSQRSSTHWPRGRPSIPLSTLLIERDVPGGQASYASLIENFFGFPGDIRGAEIARLAGRQAEQFGAELLILSGVESGRLMSGFRTRRRGQNPAGAHGGSRIGDDVGAPRGR